MGKQKNKKNFKGTRLQSITKAALARSANAASPVVQELSYGKNAKIVQICRIKGPLLAEVTSSTAENGKYGYVTKVRLVLSSSFEFNRVIFTILSPGL